MNHMMQRGEEIPNQEPFFAFHIAEIDPESLIVGALFHGYGETVHVLNTHIQSDDVVNGLIEILPNQKRSPLYIPIFDENELNWVWEYVDFSNKFQAENHIVAAQRPPKISIVEPTAKTIDNEPILPPQKIIQRLGALIDLQCVHNIDPSLLNSLRVNIRAWGGVTNLNVWLKKYDAGHSVSTNAKKLDWSWLPEELR